MIHLQVGTLFDPRPLAFTVSGFLIIFGILLVYHGLFVQRVYIGGILLMLLFLVGYGTWHTVLEHGGFWPHIHAHGHHDTSAIEIIWVHLVNDTIAMVSKIFEIILAILLTILYIKESNMEMVENE